MPNLKQFDFDDDGVIGQTDIDFVGAHIGAKRGTRRYLASCDFNDDGVIDGEDLNAIAAVFGQTVPDDDDDDDDDKHGRHGHGKGRD
jgi:hypothetical protein